ncbi:hypothetical protein NliqN6_2399 [Naganishia liquefaciens]|uniref:Peptidase C19 ubiquitin carboxyl-terminal hydrolase domain-containing protein n=1 Tax=Naganishia liquefaciens TaxID=104408 RepID=A0A8H3TRQ0_9TREE|nr:hypothetical protein NliqN6_2399 [Naganishia liquefaciens]
MASWNTEVYEQLTQMGIEGPIAQEAARRFQDVERAVNWSFDHGQSWLADSTALSAGGSSANTSELDLLGKGPPQNTHNNSPNVSPLLTAQNISPGEVEDLRDVDMTGITAQNPVPSGPPLPDVGSAQSQNPFAQNNSQKLNKTYSKKSKTAFSEAAIDAGNQRQTPDMTNRPLPPLPMKPFDNQEYRIDGESEEDQIQRAIRMSLGQDDGTFTSTPLPHSSTQHIEEATNSANDSSNATAINPPGYNEADPDRRLRASAPPPESTPAEKSSTIQLGSNNPFRAADTTSAERSVTFAQVPDDTMDQGNSSLVPVAPDTDSGGPRKLTAQEQEDADLQAALSASLTENLPGGFAPAATDTNTTGASGGMEGTDELDMDPDGKTLFDEGQRNVPLKQDGAPIAISVLWDNALYAANILQCLMATPQFSAALSSTGLPSDTNPTTNDHRLRALVNLSKFLQSSSNAYVTSLLGMNTLFDLAPSANVSTSADVFLAQIVDTWVQTDTLQSSSDVLMTDELAKNDFNPLFLSSMTLLNTEDAGTEPVTSYKINYASTGNTITECIAAEIWSESPNRFFSSIADILPIVITRGAKNVWGETTPLVLEEELYMDRFLAKNASQVAQIRGNEGLAKKKVENLQEELKKWTTHKSGDILATLNRTLKHFERKAEAASNEQVKEEVMAVIEKLKDAGASISSRREAIRRELAEEEQKSKDCWNQLDLSKERYTLQGVCFYAGWMARTSMFCYVKGSQGDWWKISDTTVEPASFEQIKGDRTGLYFDSGAYLLVYARQGTEAVQHEEQESVNMEIDPIVVNSSATSPAAEIETQVTDQQTSTSGTH